MTDHIRASDSLDCCGAPIVHKTDTVRDFGDMLCTQYTCKKCGIKWWHNIKEGFWLREEIAKDTPKPTLHTQFVSLKTLNDVCAEHKKLINEVTKPRSVSDRYRFLRIAAIAIAAVEDLDSKV